jgi:hypothetical protein
MGGVSNFPGIVTRSFSDTVDDVTVQVTFG